MEILIGLLLSFLIFTGGDAVINKDKVQVCEKISETTTVCRTVRNYEGS